MPGYQVFSHQDYESRIRGGHNFYQIRVAVEPISASREQIDILIALDRESITLHRDELAPNGRIVYDAASLKMKESAPSFFDIPFVELAVKSGGQAIMENTVATAAVLGMLGIDIKYLLRNIDETFRRKGDVIAAQNRNAALAGYDYVVKNCGSCSFPLGATAEPEPRMLLGGVESIALGALASGCKFYSAYPMTPSTGIMNYPGIQGRGVRDGGGAGRGRDRGHQHGARRVLCRRRAP